MSRTESAIVKLLLLAVVVVFAVWLGLFIDAYPMLLDPLRLASLLPPAELGREAPAETLQSMPSGSSADYGYRLCYEDIAAGALVLVDDLGFAGPGGTEDPVASCEEVAGLQLQSRALELRTAHQNCPEPSDPHLQTARQYLHSGLTESSEAGDCLERYCAGSRDSGWLSEASSHVGRASELGALADQEMQAYYGS